MTLRCINYGFPQPFGKNVVFLEDGGEKKQDVKSATEKIQSDLDTLDQSNEDMMLRTMEVMEKAGKLNDAALTEIKAAIAKIDILESESVWGHKNVEQVRTEIDAVFKDLKTKYGLSETEVTAISTAQKQVDGPLGAHEALITRTQKNRAEFLKENSDFNKFYTREGNVLTMKFEKGSDAYYYLQIQDILNNPEENKKMTLRVRGKEGDYNWDGEKNPPSFYKANGDRLRIYSGDKIEVSTSETAKTGVDYKIAEDTRTSAEKALARDMSLDAVKKNESFTSTLDIAKNFQQNAKIRIPASVQRMDPDQFARDLPYMKHGKQVEAAFKEMDSGRSINELYKDIRGRKLAPNYISLDEISLAVKGKNHFEIFNAMPNEDSMNQILILGEIESLEKSTDDIAKIFAGANAWARENSVSADQVKYVIENRPKVEEKKAAFEELKTFMAAAAKLMKEIPQLEPKEKTEKYEDNVEIEGIEDIESVASLIFPDKADRGPVDMQTLYKEGRITNDIQMAASGESAYVQLVASAIEYGANGEPVVNREKFVSRLNELKFRGLNNVQQSGDPKLIDECSKNENLEIISREFDKDISNLSELEVKLIRYGLTKDLDVKRITEMSEYKELLAGLDPVRKEIMTEIIAKGPKLTAEEFQDTANTIEKQMLLMAGTKMTSTEHPNGRTTTHLDAAGIGTQFELPRGGKATLGLDTKGNIGFGVNYAKKVGKGIVSAGAGASVGPEGMKAGANIDLTVPLDKYNEHNAFAGYAAGIDISKDPQLGFALYMGYKLNLDGTFARIEDKEFGGTESKRKLYEEINASVTSQGKEIPEELKTALVERAYEFAKNNRGNAVTEKMPDVAITNVTLALTDKGFGVGLKISIKDKEYPIYSIPAQADVDSSAELKIRAELEKNMGKIGDKTEVFVAGNMQITPDGYVTISQAEKKIDQLDALNIDLATLGLHLEPVDVGTEHRLRLKVSKSNGNVDIFTDATSGIETIVENGNVYLNIEEGENISVRRVNTMSGLRDHNGVLNTEIFISNNIHNSNEVIKADSPDFAHFEAGLTTGQTSKAVLIEAKAGKSATFAGVEGLQLNDLYADMKKMKEAGADMEYALRSYEYDRGLVPEKRAELDAFAVKMLEGKDGRVEYKKFSVEMKAKEITDMIRAYPDTANLTAAEMTYMHQALMIASLANAPKNDADTIKHIEKWNQQALESQLTKQLGVEHKQDAKEISTKIMAYYAEQIRSGNLKTSAIEKGATVQIQVGTEKIEGYRQAFYQPKGEELYGSMDLISRHNLIAIDLTPVQAKLFQDALADRLSPISEKPEVLLKSQLALSVLSAAELLLSAEQCKELADVVTHPEKAKASQEYADFYETVKQLREKGEYTMENGIVLSVTRTKEMGLYDACKNFTLVMNEKLSITIPPSAAGADVQKYVEGDKKAHYKEVGFATFIKFEKTPPPPPTPDRIPPPPVVPPEELPGGPVAKKDVLSGTQVGRPTDGSGTGGSADNPFEK